MQTKPLVIERILNAPTNRIWKALTSSEDMKGWYFDIPDFKPVVGFEFRFSAMIDGYEFWHICKVTEVIEGQKLAYTMTFKNFSGTHPPVETLVSFELSVMGTYQTRLKLVHEGLEQFPTGLKYFDEDDFLQGWGNMFDISLKQYLEKAIE